MTMNSLALFLFSEVLFYIYEVKVQMSLNSEAMFLYSEAMSLSMRQCFCTVSH